MDLEKIRTGAEMRCIYSDAFDFIVGKIYKTEPRTWIGLPEINDGYTLNGYSGSFYSVNGDKRLATFRMVRDHHGRYKKHDTMRTLPAFNEDKRRIRRYARQIAKFEASGSQAKRIFTNIARSYKR